MMTEREYAELRRDVQHIVSGRFVVSDRLLDRIEDLIPLAFSYQPEHWEVDLETQPQRAKAMADCIDELRFIVATVKDQYAGELGHEAAVQAVPGQVNEGGSGK